MAKLVVGDSFTKGQKWPEAIWPNDTIINLGKSGAGNTYINWMTIDAVLHNETIDEVFILYSDFSRTDLMFPPNAHKTLSQPSVSNDDFSINYSKQDRMSWVHSGGDVIQGKKKNHFHKSVDDSLALQYLPGYENHHLEKNLMLIVQTNSFLQSMNKKFHWSMIRDPRDKNLEGLFGVIPVAESHHLWSKCQLDKFIDPTPFEFGVRNDFLGEDNFHLTKEGMIKWGELIKQKING